MQFRLLFLFFLSNIYSILAYGCAITLPESSVLLATQQTRQPLQSGRLMHALEIQNLVNNIVLGCAQNISKDFQNLQCNNYQLYKIQWIFVDLGSQHPICFQNSVENLRYQNLQLAKSLIEQNHPGWVLAQLPNLVPTPAQVLILPAELASLITVIEVAPLPAISAVKSKVKER